ncbi:MAG: DUF2092 domain-containing protein [Acetobacteraceae bacterium]|nr:DUF2092 domain-containing protein [Acetobacteraceae bacterium]
MIIGGIVGAAPVALPAAPPAKQAQPAISEEASAALLRMGQTLRANDFSFQAQTNRVYAEPKGGEPLHIFHTVKVTVHRPNELLVEVNGDDGSTRIAFDGKTAIAYSAAQNKYASIPVPEGTIEGMLKEAVGRLGIDFPLADFLSEAPNKAFLTGVTSGRVVDTVTIDGAPYEHLFFSQPPGIELELWLSKDERSLPRRLIVTYASLPGSPEFIALFSDWKFDIHPTEADFTFQPPAGAEQVALKPPPAPTPPPAQKKGRR